MVSSRAATVAQYLAELPVERRVVVATVRDAINAWVPAGYVETMSFGMIGWGVPLSRYPDTYNDQPLGVAALAAQKSSYSLYLNCVYSDRLQEQALRDAYAAAGRRLDMGKSCVRFKSLDDVLLDAVGAAIAAMSVDRLIAVYEASRLPR